MGAPTVTYAGAPTYTHAAAPMVTYGAAPTVTYASSPQVTYMTAPAVGTPALAAASAGITQGTAYTYLDYSNSSFVAPEAMPAPNAGVAAGIVSVASTAAATASPTMATSNFEVAD